MKIAPIPFSYDSDIEALKAPFCGKNPKKNRALKPSNQWRKSAVAHYRER
jgi:hypothetical protein